MTIQKANRSVCLFGASGHAKVIIDILEREGRYCIQGLFDDDRSLWRQSLMGYMIIGGKAEMKALKADLIVSIGNNRIRSRLAAEFHQKGISFATAIHSGASISRGVQLGDGSVVMAGAVLNADTVIREHVIVNTCASIDHDCVIEDAVHIAPGAHLCGGVNVGERAFIGAGATVIPNINVGRDAVIGAGATVVKDIPDGVTVLGTPARIVETVRRT